jgi:hypothetical protein
MSGRKRRKRRNFDAPRIAEDGATASGRRSSGRRRWIAVTAVVLAIAVAAGAAFWTLRPKGGPAPLRAAIIDELGLTDPNPSLIEKSQKMLVQAGYAVDLYPSDQVTVDLFRDLPKRGYKLVIVRGHSAGENSKVDPTTHAVTQEPLVSLFTSEPYSTERHVEDQRSRRLDVVQIGHRYPEGAFGNGVQVANPPNDRYFGITPAFMEDSAQGRFKGTTVLLMGCDAVNSDGMAAALIKKGAGVVAGWDGPVSVGHTDEALGHVLQHFVVDGLAPGDAVAATMTDIGPDPAFGAKFIAYPRS